MNLHAKRTQTLGWDIFNGDEKVGRIFGIESSGRFLGRFGLEIKGRTYWSLGLYTPKDALARAQKMLQTKMGVQS